MFTVSDLLGKHGWFQKGQHKRVFEPLEAPEAGFGLTRGREAPSEAESGRGGLQRLKNDHCWPLLTPQKFFIPNLPTVTSIGGGRLCNYSDDDVNIAMTLLFT